MTLSLQEISDRLEIQDLLVDYSYAIDNRDWDALDAIFTPDASIDYTATGGIRGSLAEIKAFLPEGLAWFSSYQHLVATAKITITGDEATGRSICHNPMVFGEGKTSHTLFVGLWYIDRYVRTPEGWRIAERGEERSYVFNAPEGFPT